MDWSYLSAIELAITSITLFYSLPTQIPLGRPFQKQGEKFIKPLSPMPNVTGGAYPPLTQIPSPNAPAEPASPSSPATPSDSAKCWGISHFLILLYDEILQHWIPTPSQTKPNQKKYPYGKLYYYCV